MFDNCYVGVNVDGLLVQIQLLDTRGHSDYDRLRNLCYWFTDVLLICFDLMSPCSFANVRDKVSI